MSMREVQVLQATKTAPKNEKCPLKDLENGEKTENHGK